MTQAFNLSQLANFVNTSGQLNAATGLFNQVPVANGGTGKSTVTTGALLLGAGTSAMIELTGTTPGTTIVSSPTGWVSSPTAAVGGGDYVMTTYTSPGAWSKPGSLKAIKVTVVGAGGAGGAAPTTARNGSGGGSGGAAIFYLDAPAIPTPIVITAGTGTNSFGSLASGTAGSAGVTSPSPGPNLGIAVGGAGGTGSISPSIPASQGIIINGNAGGNSIGNPTAGFMLSGSGSPSIFGIGGQSTSATTNAAGKPGTGYGSGGSGGVSLPSASAGAGAGTPGIVIVEEFY
jgi:hypothetical protein